MAYKIPLGFRFKPSEQELIYLLQLKVANKIDELEFVKEKKLYGEGADLEPWNVLADINLTWQSYDESGNNQKKRLVYVFTKLTKIGAKNTERRAGSGTWKGETALAPVKDLMTGENIGWRRMLTYALNSGSEVKGGWIMHEYSLNGINSDYVICRIIKDDSKVTSVKISCKKGKGSAEETKDQVVVSGKRKVNLEEQKEYSQVMISKKPRKNPTSPMKLVDDVEPRKNPTSPIRLVDDVDQSIITDDLNFDENHMHLVSVHDMLAQFTNENFLQEETSQGSSYFESNLENHEVVHPCVPKTGNVNTTGTPIIILDDDVDVESIASNSESTGHDMNGLVLQGEIPPAYNFQEEDRHAEVENMNSLLDFSWEEILQLAEGGNHQKAFAEHTVGDSSNYLSSVAHEVLQSGSDQILQQDGFLDFQQETPSFENMDITEYEDLDNWGLSFDVPLWE